MSKRKGIRKGVIACLVAVLLFGVGLGLYLNDTTREAIAGLTADQILFNVWDQTDNTLEVDADAAKSYFTESATVSANAVTVTIAAVAGEKHYIQYVGLYDTTGTGAAEDLYVKDDATKVYDSAFTVTEDKEISLQGAMIVSAAVNTAMEIKASATNLTAGNLLVLGYSK